MGKRSRLTAGLAALLASAGLAACGGTGTESVRAKQPASASAAHSAPPESTTTPPGKQSEQSKPKKQDHQEKRKKPEERPKPRKGTSPRDPCRSKNLDWSVTVLKKRPGDGLYRRARLKLVNKGPGTCVFRGYPEFGAQYGKMWDINWEHGRAGSFKLSRGDALTIGLRYQDTEERDVHWWEVCRIPEGNAVGWAPQDSGFAETMPVRNEAGRRHPFKVCLGTGQMSPPRRTPAHR
ncbi:hypothetical protein [Streptomyces sp. MST-110588]|uniref:hypothetical protein n=1 Tax=Streptomyces sp. MST-110588 TaxID=2833628 RepID=UPI001F5D64C9|nr:hypothetical protein [Streptomyces sp. MST-110588]UNO42505.1 hypothetical protein KGS77_26965 [Streptomyces sp. MST-110588]